VPGQVSKKLLPLPLLSQGLDLDSPYPSTLKGCQALPPNFEGPEPRTRAACRLFLQFWLSSRAVTLVSLYFSPFPQKTCLHLPHLNTGHPVTTHREYVTVSASARVKSFAGGQMSDYVIQDTRNSSQKKRRCDVSTMMCTLQSSAFFSLQPVAKSVGRVGSGGL
jgi:hypothetical protein